MVKVHEVVARKKYSLLEVAAAANACGRGATALGILSAAAGGEVQPTALVGLLGVSGACVSEHLKALEGSGLIERAAVPEGDGRLRVVRLTRAGRGELEAFDAAVRAGRKTRRARGAN